jgi:hypothetical protein
MYAQISFEELEKLWNEFEDVPIDKDECKSTGGQERCARYPRAQGDRNAVRVYNGEIGIVKIGEKTIKIIIK